ncbi:MAG: tyrosine-type recombinase/integrase [Beijerinckiaceae bacterium]|nr:tyrosine-type recombinase/integrase [Beijerinckiaceae bacterium]
MEKLASTPGKANNVLGVLRALSKWGVSHDHDIDGLLTTDIETYEQKNGHKPWTEKQIRYVHDHATGVFRRHLLLALYTGQRGSDVVRLGWNDIDEGGFSLRQKKTGVVPWCPIVHELATEIATWERVPGPFVRQKSGKPYTRKLFSTHYDKWRANVPELEGASLHGLRATAVVRLRREGCTTLQIQDIVGMSLPMIERYCRFADKKANGKAVLHSLEERRRNTTVKR